FLSRLLHRTPRHLRWLDELAQGTDGSMSSPTIGPLQADGPPPHRMMAALFLPRTRRVRQEKESRFFGNDLAPESFHGRNRETSPAGDDHAGNQTLFDQRHQPRRKWEHWRILPKCLAPLLRYVQSSPVSG